ncbi:hypothetical protein [Planobispora rosea]|uniref:hypothetical protein n=1 Tax=Planobispora rosea TaxID=35762 RepID=UPI00083B6752|nr:hypothetical protein [Planobispora rosea]
MTRTRLAVLAAGLLLALTACGSPAAAVEEMPPLPTCTPSGTIPPEPGVCFDADGDDRNDY